MFIFPLFKCCFGISIPWEIYLIQFDSNSQFHHHGKLSDLPQILLFFWFFFLPSPMAISFCYIYQGNLIISPPTQHAHTVAHSINLPITKFSHSRYVIIFVILLKTTFRSIVGACSEHINKGVESTLKCDDVHYIADLKNATYISKNTYLTSQHLYNVQAQGRWLWFA